MSAEGRRLALTGGLLRPPPPGQPTRWQRAAFLHETAGVHVNKMYIKPSRLLASLLTSPALIILHVPYVAPSTLPGLARELIPAAGLRAAACISAIADSVSPGALLQGRGRGGVGGCLGNCGLAQGGGLPPFAPGIWRCERAFRGKAQAIGPHDGTKRHHLHPHTATLKRAEPPQLVARPLSKHRM
jgi:hypothetical protein